MILDSKNIKYDIVDISEPGKEEEKDYMQTHSTSKGKSSEMKSYWNLGGVARNLISF
jgi:hypothetical protein